MTVRAILTGLLLGLAVAGLTYFNDAVIQNTFFIGNYLPVSVFGGGLLLLFAINPLLGGVFGSKGPYSAGEVAIVLAIALAACGYPGSNYYRTFTTNVVMPSYWYRTQANWQAQNLFAYVPGGTGELAQGHVRDWRELAEQVHEAEPGEVGGPGGMLREALPEEARREFDRVAEGGPMDAGVIRRLTGYLNAAIARPETTNLLSQGREDPPDGLLDQSATVTAQNRALLRALFPDLIAPIPQGSGVLLQGGHPDPALVDPLLAGGRSADEAGKLLPLAVWWPTLRLYGGLALVLGLASLCLTMIVHPQWSRRELLSYPIVTFVREASERREGAWLPEVTRNRLFWYAFAAVVAIHLLNGSHAWFPTIPPLPLTLDFDPLRQLFPLLATTPGSHGAFKPNLYLSVIAFAFFLPTAVSLSLGLANYAFMALAALMSARGVPLESSYIAGQKSNMLRFGAYLGFAGMFAYTGRRYYANVLAAAAGFKRLAETPAYAVWAARLLPLLIAAGVGLLMLGGMSGWLGVTFILLVLLMLLVMSRIVAETGAFFLQPWFLPAGVLTALLGFESLGPTGYLILAMMSIVLIGDPRTAVMPFLINALQLGDRGAGVGPGRLSPWLAGMLALSLVVAGGVTMSIQYDRGFANDPWARSGLPKQPFEEMEKQVSAAGIDATLSEAVWQTGLERVTGIEPDPTAIRWLGLGLILVVAVAAARLRLPWWPLHPVLFLVWGTYPLVMFSFSFLLGWGIKAVTVRVGGAKGYATLKPMMVGIIAAEIAAALFWMAVSAAYYLSTGEPPQSYSIFPG